MKKSSTLQKNFVVFLSSIYSLFLKQALGFLILSLLFFGTSSGQIPASINAAGTWSASNGSGSVTFAAGNCYAVTVTEWGGGGGGGGVSNNGASGGGAGGGFAQGLVSVAGGSTCYYSVGIGGTAGSTAGSNGGAGGPTWFNGTAGTNNNTTGSFINAGGGGGGNGITSGAGAAAQSAVGTGTFGTTGVTATVSYSGGTGGGGFVNGNGDGGGGGGGAGAGAGGNGGNGATTIVGGAGAFGCPNGGGAGGGGGGSATGAGADGNPGNNNGGGGTGGAANGGGSGGTGSASAAGLAGTPTPGGPGGAPGGGGGGGNGLCGGAGGGGGDGAAGSGSTGGGGGGGTGDGGAGVTAGNGGAHGGGGGGADGGSSAAGGTGGAGYLTITVAIVPVPTASAGPIPAAICAGSTSAIMGGSVSTGATALWTGGAGTWTNASDAANASYTAGANESGTITLNLTATNSCGTANATKTITVNPAPAAPTVTSTLTYCQSATATALTATGTGLLWYTVATGGTGSATAPTPSTTAAGSTTYYVSQTQNGCESPRSAIVVTVSPGPVATASNTGPYCANLTITLNATGGGTYAWSGPNGYTGTGASPTPFSTDLYGPGIYTVTVTACNTTVTASTNVAVSTVTPPPTVTSPATYCQSATATPLTANGSNLLWYGAVTGGAGSSTAPTPSTINIGQSTYYLSQTLNNCESARDSIVVIVKAVPTSSFTATTPVCTGQNSAITYTGNATNSAGYTWSFSGGNVASGTGQGPYQVNWVSAGSENVTLSVTENGCSSTTTTNLVIVHKIPTSSFTAVSPVCAFQNSTITFTGTASAVANYQWDFSGATVVSGANVGPYQVNWPNAGSVTVTLSVSDSGCTSLSTSVPVVINPTPTASFTTITPVCSNQTSTITYSGTGTVAGTYNWGFDGAVILSGTGQGPYVLDWATGGAKNVTLSVTQNGCTSPVADSVVVVHQKPLSAFTIAPTTACLGQNSTITFTGIVDSVAVYSWSFGGGTVISGTGAGPYQINWPAAGVQTISLSITDNGCVSNDTSLPVTVNPVPVSNAGTAVSFCSGDSAVIGIASTAGYSYIWSPSAGLSNSTISNPNADGINNTAATVVTKYFVTTTQAGCSSIDSVLVTVFPLPVAAFTVPVGQCLDSNSFSLQAGGTFLNNASFSWNFGANATPDSSLIQNPVVRFSTSGTQTVSLVISQNGCNSAPYSAALNVFPEPATAFTTDTTSGCIGVQVCFAGQFAGLGTYHWTFGDGQSSAQQNPCNVYSTAGEFTVALKVTSANGCMADTVMSNLITISNPPTAAFIPTDASIQLPVDTITLYNQSVNASSYSWNLGDLGGSSATSPIVTFTLPGIYPVVLTASNGHGCIDSVSHNITVLPPTAFFIPNVFTPNGDGHNDQFYIEAQEGVTIFKFAVFDRWGEKVHDGAFPWDGTYRGKPCQEGVYVYEVELGLAGQNTGIKRKGTITLLH